MLCLSENLIRQLIRDAYSQEILKSDNNGGYILPCETNVMELTFTIIVGNT